MSIIGNRIKKRRKELNLSADELGHKIGKDRATIYRYENNDIAKLPSTILEPLASALETTPAFLMGWDADMPIPPGTHRPQFKKVPMLGYAAAGQPLEDLNQDTSYFDVENKYDVDFCITIRGDSMINAGIKDGDIVFVKSVQDIPNGKIACVEIDNEKICLKRFYRFTDSVMLVSENPANPPLHFNENNCASLKILGLAILKQSEVH
ncbi:LexA family protein [Dialister invisus]|uniref:LexA family protein n=1 Tax=Dialister invisus TaxID=218538 RepID=UPI0027BAED5D|nr:S24 family peptidase [Dialister invisus]